MLAIISPSKGQNFDKENEGLVYSQPELLDHSLELLNELKKLSIEDIGSLMSVSDKIAELNYNRFAQFHTPFDINNAKQAIFAFKGDVYTGFSLDNYSEENFSYAQKHLRILSGFYGLLKPMDLIQAYRLEMKTKLANEKGKDLYQFWDNIITEKLQTALKDQGDQVLVNLASNEYFKAIKKKSLDAKIITPVFKEKKGDIYKVIALFAKKARGLMSDYIIRNEINDLDGLKAFDREGYIFNESLSKNNELVFTRG
ncbi:peroxide stress protein YaaA [Aureibacter tunicatorum]|uniref:UPF0246 protein HNQ88_002469 n=1 Tax=Aureibacter tunicatorum TaxID=866807 RepID=A0AAE3XM26_9BACT|nr:peroxide stress protein YaaA [Aureibacter tunicatorum]MDR6239432.1 hypothetical protein [Aureibacter tunicatorum]BDD04645.1 UPF0246 protein [Aureibacter tunicatorum]